MREKREMGDVRKLFRQFVRETDSVGGLTVRSDYCEPSHAVELGGSLARSLTVKVLPLPS